MKMCLRASLLMLLVPGLLSLSGWKKQDAANYEEDASKHSTLRQTKFGDIEFKCPSFCFVRIRYSNNRPEGSRWSVDYPAGDLNFSARFQEVTGLPADPNGKVLQLTEIDPREHPFIYIAEGGDVLLSPEEVTKLREYLLEGGFLMVDDSWGEDEWKTFHTQIERVFPEREPIELDLAHPIFSCFYKIHEKPQVPSIGHALGGRSRSTTWERDDAREAHYKAIYGDEDRIVAIICHNTDLADGWERVKENKYYYHEFSLKRAFPMGINIVVYALTN